MGYNMDFYGKMLNVLSLYKLKSAESKILKDPLEVQKDCNLRKQCPFGLLVSFAVSLIVNEMLWFNLHTKRIYVKV